MTLTVEAVVALAAASALPAAVAELADCSFSSLADEDLLTVVRLAERARRQIEALDHAVIAELEARNLPGRHSMRGPAHLLSGLLNLSPAEAGSRVRHARQLGPRTTVTGERLAPLLPVTAMAQAQGMITARHADVVVATIAKLRSTALPVQELAEAEHSWWSRPSASTPGRWAGLRGNWSTRWTPTGGSPTRTRSAAGTFPASRSVVGCTDSPAISTPKPRR